MDDMNHWACLECPYSDATDFESEKALAEHYRANHVPDSNYGETFYARCAIPTFPSAEAAFLHFNPHVRGPLPSGGAHYPCDVNTSSGRCVFDGKTRDDLISHWTKSGHALLCGGCKGWLRTEEELFAHWGMEGACHVCGIHWGENVEERAWCEQSHMDFVWEDGQGVRVGEAMIGHVEKRQNLAEDDEDEEEL